MAELHLTVDADDLFEVMVACEAEVKDALASPTRSERQTARILADRLARIGMALREAGWVPSPAQQARVTEAVRRRPTALRPIASPGEVVSAARIDTGPRSLR